MRRPNKYNATRTVLDGIEFASKREAKRYAELKLLERSGEITHLETQPKYTFTVNGVKINTYTADFRYVRDDGTLVVEDVKSAPTAKKRDFRRNLKMMKALFDIDVQVVP